MPTDQLSIDYLINLYNGHNAIAERVDTNRLGEIHISTELDKKIDHWITEGRDIILTGNPGDGKTHLMNVVLLNRQDIILEKDASQKQAREILDAWRESKSAGSSFILAINHAPLRKLAEEAQKHDDFHYLYDMIFPVERDKSEIDNFILYNPEQATNLGSTVIIDLSQRELLTRSIIDPLLNKLCHLASSVSCEQVLPEGCDKCPIKYNVEALSNRNIRDHLIEVLALVSRHGFHATMRDLIGLLSYIITGGVSCDDLWKENGEEDTPNCDDYDYYNLLYNGRNKLFDALRQTFDPGIYADSKIDMRLWTNSLKEGWTMKGSYMPKDLEALKVLKRRYFFEHNEPLQKKLTRVMSNIEREFNELISRQESDQENVEKLVEMINLFYAPLASNTGQNQGYRYRLRLWNNHRYSVGQTAGYVAMRSIESSKLWIYRPRLNPKYEDAIDIRQDHVLLAVRDWLPGDASLRIDWEMHRALSAAKQGKLIHVQPYHILRRLDLFLRKLGSEVGRTSPVETIEWNNYKQRTTVRMRVDRSRMVYQDI